MPKKEEANNSIVFAYVSFYDIAYSPGWNAVIDYPTLDNALHVGTGVIVAEDKKTIILAMARGTDNVGRDVLNPLIIFKSLIKNIIRFTELDLAKAKGGK